MAKPDPWRLDRARYPFDTVVATRFGDLDVLGHINNVAMAGIFEEGRVRFNRSMRLERPPNHIRWLIADVAIAYLREAHFPEDITVTAGIARIGRSSWTILSAAFQRAGCVATSETTLVYTDAKGAAALPPEMRVALERMTIAS